MTAVDSPATAAAVRPFVVGYEQQPAEAILARSDVLAAITFGTEAPTGNDPRQVWVPLPCLDDLPAIETWRVDGEVRHGRDGDLAWAEGGGYQLLSLRVDEAAHGNDPDAAAEYAYRRLLAAMAARGYRHWLRAWNYQAGINDGTGDDERYRRFSQGRARGLAGFPAERCPAATAIGHHRPDAGLIVYTLAGHEPGRPLENPRQVSAWHYPRQYGPVPPSFARGLLLPQPVPHLMISGTASVVGHDSLHDRSDRQLREILHNLDSLLGAAGFQRPLAGSDAWLKLYLRQRDELTDLLPILAAAGIDRQRLLCLHGDVCRRDLLVEIDGIAIDRAER